MQIEEIQKAVEDAATHVLGRKPDTGGCRPFYTPEEWRARNEKYGTTSELVIVHDGGDYAPLMNLDYMAYDLFDAFMKKFSELCPGHYIEACTGWYSAVYKG